MSIKCEPGRYLRKKGESYVFLYHEILAARNDMIEVTQNGDPIDASARELDELAKMKNAEKDRVTAEASVPKAPTAPVEDPIPETITFAEEDPVPDVTPEIVPDSAPAPAPVAEKMTLRALKKLNKDNLIAYGKNFGISLEEEMTKAVMVETIESAGALA